MKNKSNFIRKTYLIDPIMLEDMNKLKEQLRLTTEVNVIRTAINLLWKDTYKYGTDPRLNPSSGDSEQDLIEKAKIKAKARQALKQEEENLRLQPKIDICTNLLHGEVETNEKGFKFCKFTMFARDEKSDSVQIVPLKSCDPILVETSLFTPSKEAVFKARPQLKKKVEGNY